MKPDEINLDSYKDRLDSLELRLAKLESAFALNNSGLQSGNAYEYQSDEALSDEELITDEEKGLESRIGRVGLAWLGNIVLLFAVLFFTEYIITQGNRLLSVIIGVISVAAILLISDYLKKSNPNLAFMFKINGQIILFYEVFRMYFFSARPLISSKTVVLIILLIIITYQVYLALREKSQAFGFLSLLFLVITAILSDTTHVMLPLLTCSAIGAVCYFYKMGWRFLLTSSIILVYVAFFMWLFGNPVMGHTFEILADHNQGHLYLFALAGSFSVLPLVRTQDGNNDEIIIGATILNGIFFTLILAIISTRFFSDSYVSLFSIITICCIIYSIVLKSVSDWKYASAFYALYGFLAMSISLYGLVGLPKVYLLLSVQSFVVVTMALWFRNRLIIVMNSLLFLTILLIYMLSDNQIDAVNFSFALVPLISARIINWQKTRLNIKTEIIRNLYLIEAFLMVLYALNHAVPKQFVTLSWTLAALFYFSLSFLLKNIKYRYMALGTMICAALYLFIIDLASIEIIYRVLALLFLAVVSIGISIYYSNRFKKTEKT